MAEPGKLNTHIACVACAYHQSCEAAKPSSDTGTNVNMITGLHICMLARWSANTQRVPCMTGLVLLWEACKQLVHYDLIHGWPVANVGCPGWQVAHVFQPCSRCCRCRAWASSRQQFGWLGRVLNGIAVESWQRMNNC